MGQTHDFPFGIMDVVDRLHLNIRRPSPRGFYVDCPICNDKRGKMHVNVQNDTWRCNYCNESGGMPDCTISAIVKPTGKSAMQY